MDIWLGLEILETNQVYCRVTIAQRHKIGLGLSQKPGIKIVHNKYVYMEYLTTDENSKL